MNVAEGRAVALGGSGNVAGGVGDAEGTGGNVSVGTGVRVGVRVMLGEELGVAVAVGVRVRLGVRLGVCVAVGEGVALGVRVPVGVTLDVAVLVGVWVGVRVGGVSHAISVASSVGEATTVGVLGASMFSEHPAAHTNPNPKKAIRKSDKRVIFSAYPVPRERSTKDGQALRNRAPDRLLHQRRSGVSCRSGDFGAYPPPQRPLKFPAPL